MRTSAGIARAPYLLTVHARVCDCTLAPRELGNAQTLDRALRRIEGYWNVYLCFFGEQVPWLWFQITDVRDGRIVWRNGRRTTEEAGHLDHSEVQDKDAAAGRGSGTMGDAAHRRGPTGW